MQICNKYENVIILKSCLLSLLDLMMHVCEFNSFDRLKEPYNCVGMLEQNARRIFVCLSNKDFLRVNFLLFSSFAQVQTILLSVDLKPYILILILYLFVCMFRDVESNKFSGVYYKWVKWCLKTERKLNATMMLWSENAILSKMVKKHIYLLRKTFIVVLKPLNVSVFVPIQFKTKILLSTKFTIFHSFVSHCIILLDNKIRHIDGQPATQTFRAIWIWKRERKRDTYIIIIIFFSV